MSETKDAKIQIAIKEGGSGLHVCVFCAANELPEKFTAPAEEFARQLAIHGHTLVWGGGNLGLMRTISDGVKAGGAKIIGVSIDFFKHQHHENADEMIIAKNLGERKAKMLERSDILVVLVGGIGTLDELSEVMELKKHHHHDKPIVILNTDGFYDGLKALFARMDDEGLLKLTRQSTRDLVHFAQTPQEAIDYINQFLPV
jgi:uncharacterized protein (TIGR00730 family)